MTQRLLIIGGGIQGMISASAAAKAGARSELIVAEHALGPIMGASLYSAGVHLPQGRRNRTRSLARKCAVALAAMAASAVMGGGRPIAKRVVAGPVR